MEWKIEMEFQLNALRFSLVIAGLDPAIHHHAKWMDPGDSGSA
jgi:hypothetical protein